ncbi:MAG: hypothetical protein JNM07_10380 [Phycisphaerae bacterium]|nr:hypothetical protein [Phycisphaerae bacterium]
MRTRAWLMGVSIAIAAGANVAIGGAGRAAPPPEVTEPVPTPSVTRGLLDEAARLRPLVSGAAAQSFLDAVPALIEPEPAARVVYRNREKGLALSETEWTALPETERGAFQRREYDAKFYYHTGYGSPLVVARALDLAATRTGRRSFTGARVLEFGYGSIGQGRVLASLGAEYVGVEVEPVFRVLYAFPGDTGVVPGHAGGPAGSLRLLSGRWPAEERLAAEAGQGFDLFISKNTLKLGYIHPRREADERMLVKLGVDDEAFVRAVFRVLRPGGAMMVYNICPAPAPPDKPYIPWADGEFPFARELIERAGFEVLAWDEDDTDGALRYFAALDYLDGAPIDEARKDYRVWWTLLRKPEGK